METIEALAVGDWVAVSRYTTVVKPIQLIQDAMKIIYTTEEVKSKLPEILKVVSAGESPAPSPPPAAGCPALGK